MSRKKRTESRPQSQSLRDEIERTKREQDPDAQILQLCQTVDSALPKIVEKTHGSSEATLPRIIKSIGFATPFILGAGLLGSVGPAGMLAGAIAAGGTWRVLSALQQRGIIPSDLNQSLKRLFEARNRILHEIDDGEALSKQEVREIVSGVEEVLQWAFDRGLLDPDAPLERLQNSAGADPEGRTVGKRAGLGSPGRLAGLARKLAVLGPFDVALKKFPDSGGGEQESGPSDPIPRAQPAESPDELLSRKKKNVELLKDLLQTTLPEGAREHLVERLRKAYGYRGPDDYILCEYCLEEDPLKILVQEFRFDDLERVARDFGLELPTVADQHELARVILKDLGFAVPDTPKGIDAALRILRGHQKEFNCARSKEEIVGLAPRTNNELERILHGLIVFYGTVFFGVQFWDVFAEWNSRFRQQRQTLGMKFNILKKMEKEVLRDPTRATKLQELFGGRKYVIGKRELQECSDVVPFRSALSHFRDKIDSMPLSSAKKWVRPFFTETVDFVDYLHKNDIYPVTVVVAGRYEDAYGRKWVECITDAGHTEKIFTNKPMQRSSEYFMLPRTNPVRIYPILVEYQEAE